MGLFGGFFGGGGDSGGSDSGGGDSGGDTGSSGGTGSAAGGGYGGGPSGGGGGGGGGDSGGDTGSSGGTGSAAGGGYGGGPSGGGGGGGGGSPSGGNDSAGGPFGGGSPGGVSGDSSGGNPSGGGPADDGTTEVYETDAGRLASPDLVDDLNQQTEGADIDSTLDPRVSIERQDGGGFRATFSPRQSDVAADAVALGGDNQPPRSTATDPLDLGLNDVGTGTAAVQPSTDRQPDSQIDSVFGASDGGGEPGFSIGGTTVAAPGDDFPDAVSDVPGAFGRDAELLESDLPNTLGAQRDAVSDSAQLTLGVDPADVNDAPVRSGLQSARDVAGGAINDARNSDGAAGKAAGAAAFGVAAPEPVSTGTGAAVLGGLALGGAITGAASELGNPEDRDDLPGEGVGEFGVPDRTPSETMVEIDVPDQTPSSSAGELGVPDQTPSSTGGEIGIPEQDITTPLDSPIETNPVGQQRQRSQEPELEEEQEPTIIGGEDFPINPYEESPQERGGTPDRFVREDRDAFVFPGSPVGTGTDPATGTTTDAGAGIFESAQPRSGGGIFGGVADADADILAGQVPASSTAAAQPSAAAADVAAIDAAEQTAERLMNPMANQTANQNTTTTTTTTTTANNTGRNPRRLRFPDLEPDADDGRYREEVRGPALEGEIGVFDSRTVDEADDRVADILRGL